MVAPIDLPSWPPGTVAILVTAGDPPHAIPVSAVLRAGPDRILLGLARRRESLTRLRRDPRVTVAVCAPDVALSADGTATVVDERLTEAVVAIAVHVHTVHDHRRPTFALHAGVAWEWTDEDAERADGEVRAALLRLAS
jgi:hypothetical protein